MDPCDSAKARHMPGPSIGAGTLVARMLLVNKEQEATSNKCHASSNKCLTSIKKLLVTRAPLLAFWPKHRWGGRPVTPAFESIGPLRAVSGPGRRAALSGHLGGWGEGVDARCCF